ncbi:hypothetical protein M422DRAFT_154583 [Sphaerobolus stellatus SS14]|nr:hypothetical protein M422DRAFT_154583 [Sphaerobolus stellatus SS14]
MSFLPLDEDAAAWGGGQSFDDVDEGDIVSNAIRKEKVLREIAAAQEDLRALLARAKAVQGDVDKLTSGNETLQMYIDNLTKQLARR